MIITAVLPNEAYDDIIQKRRFAPEDATIRCFKGDNVNEDTWEEAGEFVKIVFDPAETDILQDPDEDNIVTVSEILKEDILACEFFAVSGLKINCDDVDAEPG